MNYRQTLNLPPQGWRTAALGLLLAATGALTGCALVQQTHSTAQHQATGLQAGDLERSGVAFITPSTVTGQEEEKQAIALIFAQVIREERPAVRLVTLPETLSAVNRGGLADSYKTMYDDYRYTGIFNRDLLRKVGEVTGARYAAQLKLQGFDQGAKGRFGTFGLRLVETKHANIRLFLQIWDTTDGTIVWEGVQELNYSEEALSEKTITLRTVVEKAAHELIVRLP